MNKFFCIIAAVCLQYTTGAGVPLLERELNLSLHNEAVSTALLRISEQTHVMFSYPAPLVGSLSPVSVNLTRKTVREALVMILPDHITFRSVSGYIILKEKTKTKNPKKTEISGYVYDRETDERVANVTVYDKNSLRSATTDKYGYFTIKLPVDPVQLEVTKHSYSDTSINIAQGEGLVRVHIDRTSRHKINLDSIRWRETLSDVGVFSRKILRDFRGFVNSLNTRDTIARDFQISLLPFVGTNHRMSGSVYNRFSVNVLAGYSRGVNGLEAGGLVNIVKENVNGCQLAGLFNIVGDSTKGTQAAGLINVNGRMSSGFQAAGLLNVNETGFSGCQLAGLMNVGKNARGGSAAGLMNITKNAEGIQMAGLANVNESMQGVAVAGLFNVTSKGADAVQLAGLFNSIQSGSAGVQVAGLFNNAPVVTGIQLAPLNFADTSSGIPFGFLSFVKKGIHQLELSGDEVFQTNISLRTGVNSFHNIVSVGIKPGAGQTLWQVGYGIGTSVGISQKLRSELAVSMHHVSSGRFYLAASDLYRAYAGLEYRFGKKFTVAAGPTFNLYRSDELDPDFAITYNNISPANLFERTTANFYNLKGWIGGRVCLRFF